LNTSSYTSGGKVVVVVVEVVVVVAVLEVVEIVEVVLETVEDVVKAEVVELCVFEVIVDVAVADVLVVGVEIVDEFKFNVGVKDEIKFDVVVLTVVVNELVTIEDDNRSEDVDLIFVELSCWVVGAVIATSDVATFDAWEIESSADLSVEIELPSLVGELSDGFAVFSTASLTPSVWLSLLEGVFSGLTLDGKGFVWSSSTPKMDDGL
jgi:hypothetical protein